MDLRTSLIQSLSLCIKRGPYIHYKKYPDVEEKVISLLKMNNRGDVPMIAQKTGFKERTLYNWLAKLRNDPNFSPLDEQRRPGLQIFTDEQEDSIAEYILTEKISKGKCFTDDDCIETLIDAYLEIHWNDENINIEFSISRGYVYYFKKRHNFVSKLCHIKRRPSLNKILLDNFIDQMKKLFASVPLDRIINIDETALFIAPKNLKIWHSRGFDDVTIPVKFNEKQRVTAVCAISADGQKHNIQFIAKGQTEVVMDTQLGDCHPHLRTFSEKGWTDNTTFYGYLNYIRSLFDEGEIHIILDVFSAHRSDEIKEAAKELGIILHFIPPGFTDLFQPLDAKIFAIIKGYIRHMIRQFLKDEKVMTKRDACKFLIAAWEKLDPEEIRDSFNYLTLEERWETVSYFDLKVMHTIAYYRASQKERKDMVYNAILPTSLKDDSDVPIMHFVIDSFGQNDIASLDQIVNYTKNKIFLENEDKAISMINETIAVLVSYKLITKLENRMIPTFKKLF